MALGFQGKVRRSYQLGSTYVLILQQGYEGDIEVGDRLDIGGTEVDVVSVAWGSAFNAEDPPLTLVVKGLSRQADQGAAIKGLAPN